MQRQRLAVAVSKVTGDSGKAPTLSCPSSCARERAVVMGSNRRSWQRRLGVVPVITAQRRRRLRQRAVTAVTEAEEEEPATPCLDPETLALTQPGEPFNPIYRSFSLD